MLFCIIQTIKRLIFLLITEQGFFPCRMQYMRISLLFSAADEEELIIFYKDDYYETINYGAVELALMLLPDTAGTMLEIGCGAATLSAYASDKGWRVEGIV